MKRRTEINIELTRTLLIRRPAAPCECAVCVEHGEMITPEEAAFMADASTRVISRRVEADQAPFGENGEAGEAIEVESAEGQLILAAALRSLERRLSPEARATMSAPPAPSAARRSRFSRRFSAKLLWLRNLLTRTTSTRRTTKEN